MSKIRNTYELSGWLALYSLIFGFLTAAWLAFSRGPINMNSIEPLDWLATMQFVWAILLYMYRFVVPNYIFPDWLPEVTATWTNPGEVSAMVCQWAFRRRLGATT